MRSNKQASFSFTNWIAFIHKVYTQGIYTYIGVDDHLVGRNDLRREPGGYILQIVVVGHIYNIHKAYIHKLIQVYINIRYFCWGRVGYILVISDISHLWFIFGNFSPTIVGQSDQNSEIRWFQANSLREYPVNVVKKDQKRLLSKSD